MTALFFQYLKNIEVLLSSRLHDFGCEIHCHLNWYSSIGNVFFLSGSYQGFSLSLVFRNFITVMTWHGVLWAFPVSISLTFWICWFVSFVKYGKCSTLISSKTLSAPMLLHSFWHATDINVRFLLLYLRSLRLCSCFFLLLFSIFSLLFRLGKVYWSVLKSTDSILCYLQSTTEPIQLSIFKYFLLLNLSVL